MLTIKAYFRYSLIATNLILWSVFAPQDLRAIDPVKLKQEQGKSAPSERDITEEADPADVQQGQIARDRNQADRNQADRDQGGGLRRGAIPGFQPPDLHLRRLVLGVQVRYLETGARITRVIPNTPAWRFGLETGDVIVAIDGYQIGYVRGRLYDLPSELNARARRMGWVRLLVQNVRNNQLLNVDVHLEGHGNIFPRERELDIPLESEIDQAEADGHESIAPTRPHRER